MQKQTVNFAVTVKNGVVQEIGKGFIFHPKTNYSGGSFKWYEDKVKQNFDK